MRARHTRSPGIASILKLKRLNRTLRAPTRVLSLGVSAILAFGVAACGSEGTAPADPDTGSDLASASPATVEIGTGFPSFVPVPGGQDLPIIQGIQGGFHLWGGFRVDGLQPRDLFIEFQIEWDGETVGAASYVDELVGDGPPFEYGGVAVIFFDNDVPPRVSGDTVTLSVTLQDTDGVTVTDSVEVIPICCSF